MKMANFGAYTCCKLFFRDIYASTTCSFVSSTLQMERGVFNCLSEAERTQFFYRKTVIFFRFFIKKRQNLVHTDAVNCVSLLCVYLHPASSHPEPSRKGVRGLQLLVWGQKPSIFDQKTAIFGQFFMKNGKVWYIQMLQIVF